MIPLVFHSIWVGPPMPAHLRDYLATWKRVHPQWEHRMWGERDLDWLTNQPLFDAANFVSSRPGQFRSDVARYEILHRFGGVYVDCDFEALRPIDDLIAGTTCFAAWETDGVWINNAILGAIPAHPMLDELIAGLPANVVRRRGTRPNVMTGPQYLTPVARRHQITVFPSAAFYPYNFVDVGTAREAGPFPDAYAIHHWANRRARLGSSFPERVSPGR